MSKKREKKSISVFSAISAKKSRFSFHFLRRVQKIKKKTFVLCRKIFFLHHHRLSYLFSSSIFLRKRRRKLSSSFSTFHKKNFFLSFFIQIFLFLPSIYVNFFFRSIRSLGIFDNFEFVFLSEATMEIVCCGWGKKRSKKVFF